MQPVALIEPSAVYHYWRCLHISSPQLANVALTNWLRPISSASLGRVYSGLTQIDVQLQRSMGRTTLAQTLFLRGNALVVNERLREFVAAQRSSSAVRPGAVPPLDGRNLKRGTEDALQTTAAIPGTTATSGAVLSVPLLTVATTGSVLTGSTNGAARTGAMTTAVVVPSSSDGTEVQAPRTKKPKTATDAVGGASLESLVDPAFLDL